jgi:ribonucleotide reductase alpha subunit
MSQTIQTIQTIRPSFQLTKSFVAKFEKVRPPFGFNGLGELVYQRTYSRKDHITGKKERWVDTIERVVNGCYSMQKRWILDHNLGWNEAQAQESSQEMFDRMFQMKFLPPGRGLFCMGTSVTEERGLYAALNNCSFISTKDMDKDPSLPFLFLFDYSMLGVGVGFDTEGAGKIVVKGPDTTRESELFVIEDTREGWVKSMKKLLDSYFLHLSPVEFDYSKIRAAGLPIKTFGGYSSGPEPLKKMLIQVTEVLEKNKGTPVTDRTIADIQNLIGTCVVAGNVRRTAEIILGDPDSESFLNLKNYDLNPERMMFGWTSNNSIKANLGMDYSRVAELTRMNGEPGYFWLENVQDYSRMNGTKDHKDHRAQGTNPCITADSLIMTDSGIYPVSDLVGKSFNAVVNGRIYSSTDKGFWSTGVKRVYKVQLANGLHLKATANHEFYTYSLNRGTTEWKRLDQLKMGDLIVLSANNKNSYVRSDFYNIGDNLGNIIYRNKILIDGNETIYNQRNAIKLILNNLINNEIDVYREENTTIATLDTKNVHTIQVALLGAGIVSDEINGELIIREEKPQQSSVNGGINFGYSSSKTNEDATMPLFSPIVSITEEGQEEVFDCTINDEMHWFSANGMIVHNCCEQTLESGEMCNLVEVFPTKHETEEDFNRTLKFAYLYAKTVTLGNSHWPETNRVMLRNRRIGCSLTGVTQFVAYKGINELKKWCHSGYNTIQKYDKIYSDWLAIPRSIKTTTVKPSGTVSLLAGATPGMHWPESNYYIRRVRLSANSELIEPLRNAGYVVEPCAIQPTTTSVVEIPVFVGNMRTVNEVSMWEQLELAAFLQEHWADNQVSSTVTFKPETEGHQIKQALDYFQYKLKGVSFLPKAPVDKYPQLPYEEITKERYEEMMKNIKELDFENFNIEDAEDTKFCDGDKCELK